MAALSQTITNSLSIIGKSPATLWDVDEWGTATWGADEDLRTHPEKWLSEGLDFTDALGKDFVKAPIAENLTLTSTISPITRMWGIWDYLFTVPSSDGSLQAVDQFTKLADNATNYTKITTDETEWT